MEAEHEGAGRTAALCVMLGQDCLRLLQIEQPGSGGRRRPRDRRDERDARVAQLIAVADVVRFIVAHKRVGALDDCTDTAARTHTDQSFGALRCLRFGGLDGQIDCDVRAAAGFLQLRRIH